MTMTIREVAEILGVSGQLVRNRLKELFPEKLQAGKTTLLNEAEVTAVKMRIEENPAIITTANDRLRLPKTALEKALIIQQAIDFMREDLKTLQIENEILKPKAIAYDRTISENGSFTVAKAAKIMKLGYGRNKLYQRLRELGLLTIHNEPYQRYVDQGIFKVVQGEANGHVYSQLLITQKGIDYLIKRGF